MKVCPVCKRCYEDSTVSCVETDHQPLSEKRRGGCEIIEGYRLEFLLESSAKYQTYRARQTDSGQTCLIKILAEDEELRDDFLSEAKTAAALVHPNIAEVYESGVLESGEAYVIAEDVEGRTLREYFDESGAPPLLTAVLIARQTAEALHAVHRKGLLHRAVSPENIVLTTDAASRILAKICNFDFAGVRSRFISSNRFLSPAELNSLKYFAPEQCTGTEINERTDVYGLGVVFYEMLAGAPPFDAPKASLLIEKHKNEPPPEFKINNFELRMLLTHTLMEALRKQPGMRLTSANAFARQLRHIEQLATHSPAPPPVVGAKPKTAAPSAAEFEKIENETFKPDFENSPSDAEIKNEPVALTAQSITVEENAAFIAELENASCTFENESEPAPFAANSAEIPKILNSSPTEPLVENFAEDVSPVTATAKIEPIPVEPAKDENLRAESVESEAERKPLLIDWEQLEDDIPSEADVLEVQLREQLSETFETPAAQSAAEEISPADDLSRRRNFSPEDEHAAPSEERKAFDPRPSVLSAYGSQSARAFSGDHRSLFIGGSFIGLLVVFFAGYALLNGHLDPDSWSEPVSAKTAPERETIPQDFAPAKNVSPYQQKPKPTTEQPSAEDSAVYDQLRPIEQLRTPETDERAPIPREKPNASASKPAAVRSRTPKTPETSPTAEKTPRFSKTGEPLTPSTVVIFPDGGKVKSKIETERKPAPQKPSAVQNQTGDFTRPRIVKNPKP